MDEVVQSSEAITVSSEDVTEEPHEIQEPPEKNTNFIGCSREMLIADQIEASKVNAILSVSGIVITKKNTSNVQEFYEQIDPSQPSTSNVNEPHVYQSAGKCFIMFQAKMFKISEKYQYQSNQIGIPLRSQRNRLRAQRNTSVAIAEAAQKNGMQTVNRVSCKNIIKPAWLVVNLTCI